MKDFSRAVTIGSRTCAYDSACIIVAEAGVSHFGDLQKARRLVDMAVEAKADFIKFQHFKTDLLIGPSSPEWRTRMRGKELTDDEMRAIHQYCADSGIDFLCTAHDQESLAFVAQLDPPAFKIGSGELNNWPFLESAAALGKPLILSTGMYTIDDIRKAIEIILRAGCHDLIVLHCVTRYPTPPDSVNLRSINAIRDVFAGPVGYSDHTENADASLAAVALGACMIEKHITLDVNVPNAHDWKVSCTPATFPGFVSAIRNVETLLGDRNKPISEEESKSMSWATKSLAANIDISAGTTLTKEHLVAQRPGGGIPPHEITQLLGKSAAVNISRGQQIQRDHLKS
jgi:N,N'-diacetyllegionaminate synthase